MSTLRDRERESIRAFLMVHRDVFAGAAVLDLPLGDPAMTAPVAVMVNVLGGPAGEAYTARYPKLMAEHPSVKVHGYGKDSRPGRKVGHINVTGTDLNDVLYEARAAAAALN